LLAALVFPAAFFASAALGYIFGVIALAIGVWLAVKRAGKTLPLVLGIVLAVIAVISITGTAFVHMFVPMTVYSVSKAVEETTKTKYAGVIGQAVTVGNWEITVLNVKEAKYLKSGDIYYAAEEGQKAVIATLRIMNIGKETRSVSDLWSFTLVTNVNKSYATVFGYKLISLWNITDEVKASATTVNKLEFGSLAPGTYTEGDILFTIPQNETPQKLHFKVGIVGPTEVSITLTR